MSQDAHKKVFDQLKMHLLLNLSRCKRKMYEYNEAIKLATEVILSHPTCYEAFHARAKANHAAGHLDAAMCDLTEAVRVAPQNTELHRILIALKKEIKSKSNKVTLSIISDFKSDCHDSSSGVGSSFEGSTITNYKPVIV